MAREQIDQFMNAIAGIESGGASDPVNVQHGRTGAHGIFQIMPNNWSPWAQEAGLGANAPKTAENQRRVARHKMQQYYDQFGSWEAVAVAWFAGPGRAKRYLQGDRSVMQLSDGHTTVGQYIDKLRSGMGGSAGPPTGGGPPGPDAPGPDDEFTPPREEFTHDAGALLAEVFANLSDTVAGRDPNERESFGGVAEQSAGMTHLGGAAGEGAMRTGQAVLDPVVQREQRTAMDAAADPLGTPITDDGGGFTIPGGSTTPSSKGIPQGLQSNASRGAQAARQTLGFDGEIGGIGDRDHGTSDHPHGNAIDLMTHDNKQQGQQMAEWYRQNRDQLGVTYVIFDGKIASPRNGWEWRPYSHPTGRTDPTAMHEDHVHISFKGDS